MENKMPETKESKLDSIIFKFCAGAIALVISFGGVQYMEIKQRTTILEDRVSFLYQDKVSRAEFREEMNQLRQQNDANKSDIVARIESQKSDVLARIDLIIPRLINRTKGE